MKKYFSGLVAVLAFSSLSTAAFSQEAAFLKGVSGSWTGSGTVKVRTNASPVKVTCNFELEAPRPPLSWTEIAVAW